MICTLTISQNAVAFTSTMAPTAPTSAASATTSRVRVLASVIAPAGVCMSTVAKPPAAVAIPTAGIEVAHACKEHGRVWTDARLQVGQKEIEPVERDDTAPRGLAGHSRRSFRSLGPGFVTAASMRS
jgi:hypothetical protein